MVAIWNGIDCKNKSLVDAVILCEFHYWFINICCNGQEQKKRWSEVTHSLILSEHDFSDVLLALEGCLS